MKNTIRNITLKDLGVIREWWEIWDEPIPRQEDLPNNGLGGLVLERDNTLIAVSFIYLTNSKSAYLSYLISDPKKPLGKEEQKMLTDACLIKAKDWGCTSVFVITKLSGLISRLEDYGFVFSKKEYANGFCRLI